MHLIKEKTCFHEKCVFYMKSLFKICRIIPHSTLCLLFVHKRGVVDIRKNINVLILNGNIAKGDFKLYLKK